MTNLFEFDNDESLSASSFIETGYKDYSMYVIEERAIPSMIDGLKPSQRKALFCAISDARSFTRTAALSGITIAKSNYHHGDVSMSDALSKMAADWNNNAPLLDGDGNFGNRFDKSASAARYTKVRLSKNFSKFFSDNDILEEHLDPENPEPKNYLPIIPWVLVNGTSGIAIGFATDILPRNPKDLIKASLKLLDGKEVSETEIPPFFASFKGKIGRSDDDRWYQEGTFERVSGNKIRVTEIPTSEDRLRYVARLDKLEDAGLISNYVDGCDKKGFDFLVTFPRGSGNKTDEEIIKMFGLRIIISENLTVINEHGRVEKFHSPIELMKRFLVYREQTIITRYQHYIKRDEKQSSFMNSKIRFIKAVLGGEIQFIGNTRDSLKNKILDVVKPGALDHVERLSSMSVSSFTDDNLKEAMDEYKNLGDAIKEWNRLMLEPKMVLTRELREV